MKILLTGHQGYLGSVAGQELERAGHAVVGLDTGFYADTALFPPAAPLTGVLRKDIRHVVEADLAGFDAVVHMAELSNDPLGQLLPAITTEINQRGSVALARRCRDAGVSRFVYMSSCSVYGVAAAEVVDETSPVNPQTVYAECKVAVEREVSMFADERFSPTYLRNATAYGASPHMRFDIVLNNLAGLAWTTREIKMTSDGTPWRPLVHGLDIVQAILAVLEAPREAVFNQVFNVGDTAHNYQVRQIAEIVAEVFPECQVSFGPPSPDNRSYRVSFEKIQKHLPGFKCQWDARRGAVELLELFQRVSLTPELFRHRAFTRLHQLEHLLASGAIDEHFFWRSS
jgi:nucleoside-diphosphate-sugar epimerase